jgi:RNA polymerase sigma factor (sigma-70 family)
MAAAAPSAATMVESQATVELVWNAIATLSEVQQSIMALRWQAQLPWDEIAPIVGLSTVAVRKQHSRALARLRTVLPAHLTDD